MSLSLGPQEEKKSVDPAPEPWLMITPAATHAAARMLTCLIPLQRRPRLQQKRQKRRRRRGTAEGLRLGTAGALLLPGPRWAPSVPRKLSLG